MYPSKKTINLKNIQTLKIQEIWKKMKRPNLQIVGIEEVEEILKVKIIEKYFNKVIEKKSLNLKRKVPIKV